MSVVVMLTSGYVVSDEAVTPYIINGRTKSNPTAYIFSGGVW
jgi:hypothetical protein